MRAQTQIDFLTGATLFLLATLTAFAIVPSLVAPYGQPGGFGVVVADSTATRLATGVLTSPEDPYTLDPDRVAAFFSKDFDAARETVGLDSRWMLNVTLVRGSDRWTLGPTPPNRRDTVSTAWRVVSLNDTRATLRVRVW